MAKPTQIEYPLKELAALMVRDQGLKEGHWMLLVRFAHTVGNLETGESELSPVVITRIQSLGIQEVPAPNPMSVDASALDKTKPKARAKASAKAA